MELEENILDSTQDDWGKSMELAPIRGHSHQYPTLTLDLLGISGTGIVGIDLLRRGVLIERNETMQEVFTS